MTMQEAVLHQRKQSGDGQKEPVSGLHNQSTLHALDSFLESVLVPSPVSISAELVPSVLSRGLGLETYSESIGQQGSNDRRSGRQRSSVSNGVQGNTNNNNTVTGARAAAGGAGAVGGTQAAAGVGAAGVGAAGGPGGASKVRFESINAMSSKDEAKNNLVSINRQPSNARNNQVDGEGYPDEGKALQDGERRLKTRKRDNNSTAGGTSRKKKSKDSDKMGSPAGNAFPPPPLPPPGGMGQYVFGVPQMGLPSQMPPHQLQQMQQQLQQQMQMSQMGQMGQMLPQPYLYAPPVQLPDGRIAGFYPGMDQFPMPENVDRDLDHTVKRSRLVWTSDLHKKFLDAVERCGGIDQALPKAIMNDMKVAGLTRENVSSHLQKYRIRMKERAEKEAEGGDVVEERYGE